MLFIVDIRLGKKNQGLPWRFGSVLFLSRAHHRCSRDPCPLLKAKTRAQATSLWPAPWAPCVHVAWGKVEFWVLLAIPLGSLASRL